jgi:hypothetical protein
MRVLAHLMPRYNPPALMVIWRAICCNLPDIRTWGCKIAREVLTSVLSSTVTRDKERAGSPASYRSTFVPCVVASGPLERTV